jgi:antagonist of KipI
MSISIIKPGICSAIQDLGRTGYRSLGIGSSGVMDFFAASVANYLVGNDEKMALIEMHFPAATIVFQSAARISITGADFTAHINDTPVPLYQPLYITDGDVLSFKKNNSGVRAYIAIGGGMIIDHWLGSYSTHVKVAAGGYKGRLLQKDDTIILNAAELTNRNKKFSIAPSVIERIYSRENVIRCIAGPEYHLLNTDSENIFSSASFVISNQSDRMGYRLQGDALSSKTPADLISSAVGFGTIQLLPNGQLIVLMADHQTTGGYPRIAAVITADLPRLAQLPVNTAIQFKLVTLSKAEEILLSMHQTINEIKKGCQNFYAAH